MWVQCILTTFQACWWVKYSVISELHRAFFRIKRIFLDMKLWTNPFISDNRPSKTHTWKCFQRLRGYHIGQKLVQTNQDYQSHQLPTDLDKCTQKSMPLKKGGLRFLESPLKKRIASWKKSKQGNRKDQCLLGPRTWYLGRDQYLLFKRISVNILQILVSIIKVYDSRKKIHCHLTGKSQ